MTCRRSIDANREDKLCEPKRRKLLQSHSNKQSRKHTGDPCDFRSVQICRIDLVNCAEDCTQKAIYTDLDDVTTWWDNIYSRSRTAERLHKIWERRVQILLFPNDDNKNYIQEGFFPQQRLISYSQDDERKEYLHQRLYQILKQVEEKQVEQFKARWNFDPVNEIPLQGCWKWVQETG
eukprot:jgi/Galph1/4541/GphlegSOOS_G3201.1